jgi:hypothetical protein
VKEQKRTCGMNSPDYERFFDAATGGQAPYDDQIRLATDLALPAQWQATHARPPQIDGKDRALAQRDLVLAKRADHAVADDSGIDLIGSK